MNISISTGEISVQPPASRSSCAPCVLVLDDDTATRRIMAITLAHVGYSVVAAEDGEMGWDSLCSAHYDLLVTDHEMPHLKGLQLIERLRAAGLTLPVIIASGSLELGEVKDYPRLALAAVLQKPFDFAALIAVVRLAAPLSPEAIEGTMHYRELQRCATSHVPFPASQEEQPEVLARTA